MTLEDLEVAIARLREEGHNPNAEVRFVYQQNYPLQDEVQGVAVQSDIDDGDTEAGSDADIVYLVSGGQVYSDPYGPRAAWDVCCQ